MRRFRLQNAESGEFQIDYLGLFGETQEPDARQMVESIAGDPSHNRLMIVDEHAVNGGPTLREYTLGGPYTGRSLPTDSFAAAAVAAFDLADIVRALGLAEACTSGP